MSIDWQAIHKKLAAAAATLELGMVLPPAETGKILKARARALARETERDDVNGESVEILEFSLAYENYGVESSFVREVYPLKSFTQLPGTPPFVLGIVNVRGQVYSVVDLKKFFDLPDKGLSDLNKVIIIHNPVLEFGILADAIAGIRSIRISEIQSSLPTLTGIRQDYLRGVTRERLVVLDAAKLLADKTLVVHETAAA
jgi:Chemotaxis signal transduction protein